MVPLATRSSSPRAPSVMLKVVTLPTIAAGSTYQCGVALPGAGPYFQYCMPTGRAAGQVMVMAIVPPGVQPPVVKLNNPWVKITPAGGGPAALPVTGMSCAVVKVHAAPPPVKLAVTIPVPVADGAEKELKDGVTLA